MKQTLRIITSILVITLACPGCGHKSSGSSDNTVSVNMSIPSDLGSLDAAAITGLNAEMEIAGVGTYQLNVNASNDSINGTITNIPEGSYWVTVRYYLLYGLPPQSRLVLAEQTQLVMIQGGIKTEVDFPSANNTHPNEDTDFCPNLEEIKNGWNPLVEDSICGSQEIRDMMYTFTTDWYFGDIDFPSADEGWVVGSYSELGAAKPLILHYQSGTWSIMSAPNIDAIEAGLEYVNFVSVDEGWVYGVKADNLGIWDHILLHYKSTPTPTWTDESATLPSVTGLYGIYAMDFPSADEGWMVGYKCNSGACNDGDETGLIFHYKSTPTPTWTDESSSLPAFANSVVIEGVRFPSAGTGWVEGMDCGPTGSCYGDSDNAPILLKYSSTPTPTWTDVTSSLGISGTDWWIFGMYFPSTTEGWLYPTKTGLLHYQDPNWNSTTYNMSIYDFDFISPAEGCSTASVYSSGIWIELYNKTSMSLDIRKVSMPDANTCWYVGSDMSNWNGEISKFKIH